MKENIPKVKSRYLFTQVSMLSIGLLNFLSEVSNNIKNFLTLSKVIGPYSGKILFGILIGLVASYLYYKNTKDKNLSLKKLNTYLFITLVISCLLVFMPFIHLLLGK